MKMGCEIAGFNRRYVSSQRKLELRAVLMSKASHTIYMQLLLYTISSQPSKVVVDGQ